MEEGVLERRLARATRKVHILECMLEDKTRELFLANQQLEDRNKYLSDVLRSMAGALVLIDEAGRIQLVNERLIAMTGRSRDALIGASVTDVLPEAGTYRPERERTAIEEDTVLATTDGPIPVSLTHGELRGDQRGRIYVAIDARERKHQEARLKAAQEDLVRASRRAGQAEVASGVIHNVGNVLTAVNVLVEGLQEACQQSRVRSLQKLADLFESEGLPALAAGPKAAQVPTFMRRVTDSLVDENASRTATLDTLAGHVAHIQAVVADQQRHATAGVALQSVRFGDITRQLRDLVDSRARERGVTVEFAADPDWEVETDPHQVLQILTNLVLNAIRASDDDAGHVAVKLVHDEVHWSVSVCDSGVGFATENLARVFAHGFTTRADGHGFGLHSSANAAARMGGTLTAHSDGPGTGATFTLTLPLERRTEAA